MLDGQSDPFLKFTTKGNNKFVNESDFTCLFPNIGFHVFWRISVLFRHSDILKSLRTESTIINDLHDLAMHQWNEVRHWQTVTDLFEFYPAVIIVSCLMAHVLPCLPDALEQRLMNVKFVFFRDERTMWYKRHKFIFYVDGEACRQASRGFGYSFHRSSYLKKAAISACWIPKF